MNNIINVQKNPTTTERKMHFPSSSKCINYHDKTKSNMTTTKSHPTRGRLRRALHAKPDLTPETLPSPLPPHRRDSRINNSDYIDANFDFNINIGMAARY